MIFIHEKGKQDQEVKYVKDEYEIQEKAVLDIHV